MKLWSKEEEKFLKENWDLVSRKKIKKCLNRSIHSIYNKAKELGLKINKNLSSNASNRRWTAKEINIIKKEYCYTSIEDIMKKIDRTKSSIFQKANELGLKQLNIWNAKEIKILKSLYSSGESIDNISKKLNRSVNSVKGKAKCLKIKHSSIWTDDDICRLEILIKEKKTDKEISEILGRSYSSIKTKRINIFGNKRVSWTNKEIEIIKNNYADLNKKDILNLLPGRNYRRVCELARKMKISKNYNALWSGKEIEILNNSYSSTLLKDLIKLLPNKNKNQIVNKSKKLGLKKDKKILLMCWGGKIPLRPDKNGVWRRQILKIDCFQCQECGFIDETGIELQAHHIKPVRDCNKEEKYDICNGICLCVRCHKLIHLKEYEYIDKYKDIIKRRRL